MRRLRGEWRSEAQQFANSCWHTKEYRFFVANDAPGVEVAELAAINYRSEVNRCYRWAMMHKRSQRAMEELTVAARRLAQCGLYLLERREEL